IRAEDLSRLQHDTGHHNLTPLGVRYSEDRGFANRGMLVKNRLDLAGVDVLAADRKSTRLNSSHVAISYAVFCLKKKKKNPRHPPPLSLALSLLLPPPPPSSPLFPYTTLFRSIRAEDLSRLQHDTGHHNLTPLGVRYSEDRGFANRGMLVKNRLDLAGVDVLA